MSGDWGWAVRRPADHLRGGKLPRPDQAERDQMIAALYQEGASQDEIADAFLVSRVTVWSAIARERARISMSDVALFREARKRSRP